MNKEAFKKVLALKRESAQLAHEFCDVMDKMLDGRFVPKYDEKLSEAIDILFNEIYTEEGTGWIGWFIYEKDGREDFKAWTKDGKEICADEDGLWEYLEKEYRDNGKKKKS